MELKVIKRAKDMMSGAFKIGAVVSLDVDDMIVYHQGLAWNVHKREDGRFALGRFDNGTERTVFEVVAQ